MLVDSTVEDELGAFCLAWTSATLICATGKSDSDKSELPWNVSSLGSVHDLRSLCLACPSSSSSSSLHTLQPLHSPSTLISQSRLTTTVAFSFHLLSQTLIWGKRPSQSVSLSPQTFTQQQVSTMEKQENGKVPCGPDAVTLGLTDMEEDRQDSN